MDLLADFGAVSGAISLAWLLRNWWHDRVDLRVTAMVAIAIPATPGRLKYPLLSYRPDDLLSVTLANHGRRDVYVQALGGEFSDESEFIFRDATGLPATIKEGQSTTFAFDLEVFSRSSPWVTALFARDGLGRKWRLTHPAFLELQVAAKRRLAQRKVDEAQAQMQGRQR